MTAVIRQAAAGLDEAAWRLATSLFPVLHPAGELGRLRDRAPDRGRQRPCGRKPGGDCFREALALWRPIKGYGLGYALENLGRIQLRTGRLDEAIPASPRRTVTIWPRDTLWSRLRC